MTPTPPTSSSRHRQEAPTDVHQWVNSTIQHTILATLRQRVGHPIWVGIAPGERCRELAAAVSAAPGRETGSSVSTPSAFVYMSESCWWLLFQVFVRCGQTSFDLMPLGREMPSAVAE